MRETDEELRLALREGRARVVSAVDAVDDDMDDANDDATTDDADAYFH